MAAGYASNGVTDDFAVARYNTNGTLDTTFGTGGKVLTNIGPSATTTERAYGIAVQTDGKIVVVGGGNSASDFAVVRYNTDGSLDTTFGTGGKVITNVGTTIDEAYSVAIQTDGKIVVAGYAQISASNYDFAVVRYNTNGTLDTTFDTDGKLTTPFGTGVDRANSVIIQPDGKIVAGGYTDNNGSITNTDFALARYNTDGSLDTSFDADGKVTTGFGVTGTINDQINSIALQTDGKIVAAGYATISSKTQFALARYNTDGSLDSTFDTDGKATTDINPTFNSTAYAVLIQPNNKIVAAGYTSTSSLTTSNNFAVVRYNANGGLDNTPFAAQPNADIFGTGGIVTTDFGGGNDTAYAVAIQPDGKLIVGGQVFGGNGSPAIVRYAAFDPTAASSSISGRVTTASGQGIRNVTVQIYGGNLPAVRSVRTNTFGYYRFDELAVGQTYVLTVAAKRFTFPNPTRVINLADELSNEDFVSDEK